MDPFAAGNLFGELYMEVNGINVLEELLAVFCLLDDKGVIHIPKPKSGWIGGSVHALDSNTSMNRLSTTGLMGEPMAARWTCLLYLPWKRKYVFFKQHSSNVLMCCMDIEVLLWCCQSCCSLCLMEEMAWSTGTDVKRAFTSYG